MAASDLSKMHFMDGPHCLYCAAPRWKIEDHRPNCERMALPEAQLHDMDTGGLVAAASGAFLRGGGNGVGRWITGPRLAGERIAMMDY